MQAEKEDKVVKQENTEGNSPFRFSFYYYSLGFLGIFIPAVTAVLAVFFEGPFSWLGEHRTEAVVSLFAISGVHFLLYAINEVLKRRSIFTLSIYVYTAFFLYFIYLTGAESSSFIFLLFFPIISTSVYLDKRATRNIGITVTTAFALLIIFDPAGTTSPVITKHIIETVLIGTISYLMYSVVVETMRQKYEKDEASKKMSEFIQVDRLKSDFLSVAQHQLRTPISGVKWALEMIKDQGDAIPAETMSLIEAGLERINDSMGIINQMLKTVEASGDSITLTPEKVDIVGIMRLVIAELNFVTLKKDVKLAFISPESLVINADRDKIKSAMMNIVDNAFKYSPHGRVTVTMEEGENMVAITVEDTGVGIPPGDLPYIFYRLHRGKNAVEMEPDGSGIGLYTAKRIVELHGGNIQISSELGKGTKVRVELPKN